MPKRIVFILILMTVATLAFAQSSAKKKRKEKAKEEQDMPTSLDPNKPAKEYKPKKSKTLAKGPTFESDEEYRKRMEAVVKQKQKDERYLDQPQYTDPMYFGHKRPPKKRKPSKMKYCKVCGIRH